MRVWHHRNGLLWLTPDSDRRASANGLAVVGGPPDAAARGGGLLVINGHGCS